MKRMKSLLGVLVAVLLLVAGAGIAGAAPLRLVIDNSHGQIADLSGPGGLADALHNQGWEVDFVGPGQSIQAALENCSLLVVPQPTTQFAPADRNAVLSYVQGGGGLWVLYDADAPQPYLNDLPEVFGVMFDDGVVTSYNALDDVFNDQVLVFIPADLASHPLFNGVTAFTYYRGVSLNPGTSPVVVPGSYNAYVDGVLQPQPPLLAAAEIGTGHVVFIGDTTPLEPSSYLSLDAGTKQLLDNILTWLKKPEAPPEAGPIPVTIDIRPWSHENKIDLQSRGVVRVAVLTSPEFDVKQVDPKTVRFAEAKPLCWVRIDVNRDRDKDLLFLFSTRDLKLTEESTEGTLTGKTLDGEAFEGTDTVQILQHKKCQKPEKPGNKGNNCDGKKR